LKIVLQRVKHASVKVNNEVVGKIEKGFLVLIGAEKGDTEEQLQYWAGKCVGLRVFEDENGKLNLSISDVGGSMLVVSQFTLCASVSKGRRPSFDNAMPPVEAERMYDRFCDLISGKNIKVERGRFGAKMDVELINDGPVTLVLEN
jgi:D-tyrosyl-tRNA(Tyr) deacylase